MMNTTRTASQSTNVMRDTPMPHLAHPSHAEDVQFSRAAGINQDPQISEIVESTGIYNGPERRASRRIPKTLEISVQPLNDQLEESGDPFFAITRDISQGGLAYLSSRRADFERAVISINDGIAPGIVSRICNSSVIHCSGMEEFCLTNVQFLFLRKSKR